MNTHDKKHPTGVGREQLAEQGRLCPWCGKVEDAHGPPGLFSAGGPMGRMCPVPGVTSQFFAPKPERGNFYHFEALTGSAGEPVYRVADAADDRVATCFLEENARLVVRLMNACLLVPGLIAALDDLAHAADTAELMLRHEYPAEAQSLGAKVAAAISVLKKARGQ